MNDRQTSFGYAAPTPLILDAGQRNRVLRNTYWLLALSLVPTVLGTLVGVYSGLTQYLRGVPGLLLLLVVLFGFLFAINKTKNSAAGVPVLLAFTFFMGMAISPTIAWALGFKNGPSLVMTALGGTAGVFFVMASLATVIKRDLSGLGKWLFVGLLVVIIGSVINVFIGSSATMLALSTLCIGIFSLFMLYDVKRIIDGGETNYITATLALYLDIINVFQSLLSLLGVFGGNSSD